MMPGARGPALMLAAVLLLPTMASATPESARERAHGFLLQRLVAALGLSQETASAVRAVFEQAEERRTELIASRARLDHHLRDLLARQQSDARELEAAIREASGIDRSLAEITEDSFRDTQALLTREQQAKLLLLRYELQGEIHDVVRSRLKPR